MRKGLVGSRHRGSRVAVCLLASAGILVIGPIAAAGATKQVAAIHIGASSDFEMEFGLAQIGADPRINIAMDADVDDEDGVPTLQQLLGFDVLLVHTGPNADEYPYAGGGIGTQLGNVLDDYALSGGRIVFTAFAGQYGLAIDGDIEPMLPYSIVNSGNGPAGAMDLPPLVPSHPALEDVATFQSSYAGSLAVSEAGTVLAQYESSLPLAITNHDDSIMMINAAPTWIPDYSNGTDFARLFANALAIPAPSTSVVCMSALTMLCGRRRPHTR